MTECPKQERPRLHNLAGGDQDQIPFSISNNLIGANENLYKSLTTLFSLTCYGYVCNHSNGSQTTNNSLVGLVQLTLLCSNQVLCAHRVLTPM